MEAPKVSRPVTRRLGRKITKIAKGIQLFLVRLEPSSPGSEG
jgi:hypothetical protein